MEWYGAVWLQIESPARARAAARAGRVWRAQVSPGLWRDAGVPRPTTAAEIRRPCRLRRRTSVAYTDNTTELGSINRHCAVCIDCHVCTKRGVDLVVLVRNVEVHVALLMTERSVRPGLHHLVDGEPILE